MIDPKEIAFFSSLTEAEAIEIRPSVVSEHYAKKDMIFSEGDPSDWFYIVERGKVKITKLSYDGKEIILEIIGAGDFFGGMAALRGFPYPANAVAMEESDILKISRADILKIVERFPSVMLAITQSLGDRIRDSHETTKNIALEKVASRIASLLIKLSEKSGLKTPSGIEIDMRLTKMDIAEMVGTTVETSIRTMSEFKRLGLIEEKAGRITIKDLPGLKSIGL